MALVYLLNEQGLLDGLGSATEEAEETITEITTIAQTRTVLINSTSTVAAQQSATVAAISLVTDTPSPTETFTPTPSPTATATDTPTPTPTDTPSPTPVPTTPAPTPCSVEVAGGFLNSYQNTNGRLGCPVSAARSVYMAQEAFNNGRMFWRSDNGKIYVLYGNDGWARYDDIWVEGTDNWFSCGEEKSPPTPWRGFGAIWCTYDEVRNGLGNATTAEWPETNTVQDFTGGFILRDSGGRTYVLLADGTWR
jgi:hypothetical protein